MEWIESSLIADPHPVQYSHISFDSVTRPARSVSCRAGFFRRFVLFDNGGHFFPFCNGNYHSTPIRQKMENGKKRAKTHNP
jgi:hypothetical protein